MNTVLTQSEIRIEADGRGVVGNGVGNEVGNGVGNGVGYGVDNKVDNDIGVGNVHSVRQLH